MVNLFKSTLLPALLLLVAFPAAPQGSAGVPGSAGVDDGQAAAVGTGQDKAGQDKAEQGETKQLGTGNPGAVQEGDRLEASGRYQAAIAAYTRVEQPSAALWNRMGIAYLMLYDLKDAERCFRESLKLETDNPNALINLGAVEDQMQEFPAAERSYRKAVKLDPLNALAWRNLGTNLLLQGESGKSAMAYRQALAINPHIFDATSGPKVEEPGAAGTLGAANYLKARSCARAGLADCALHYLERAFHEGSATVKLVNTEADFAQLRGTPEMDRLLAEER